VATIEIEIRLFASLRDKAGAKTITLQVRQPATVAGLMRACAEQYGQLEPYLPSAIAAVNRAFAAEDQIIGPDDEIALFPPVSGGSGADQNLNRPAYVSITGDAIDIELLHDRLASPEVGAIVTFMGKVRGRSSRPGQPKETVSLEYEAYHEMANERMLQVAEEILEQWPEVLGVAIVQRIGRLEVGKTTTAVCCAAGHRDQGAFEAARYGIDRLKEIVPVWKLEVGSSGSTWIEGHYRPSHADNRS